MTILRERAPSTTVPLRLVRACQVSFSSPSRSAHALFSHMFHSLHSSCATSYLHSVTPCSVLLVLYPLIITGSKHCIPPSHRLLLHGRKQVRICPERNRHLTVP